MTTIAKNQMQKMQDTLANTIIGKFNEVSNLSKKIGKESRLQELFGTIMKNLNSKILSIAKWLKSKRE